MVLDWLVGLCAVAPREPRAIIVPAPAPSLMKSRRSILAAGVPASKPFIFILLCTGQTGGVK